MNKPVINDALFGEDLLSGLMPKDTFQSEYGTLHTQKQRSMDRLHMSDVLENEKDQQRDPLKYTDAPLGRPRSGFDYVIATDGACSGNPGPGGWAWVDQVHGAYQSGGEKNTTNNRMELIALIRGLEYVPVQASLLIRADSSYVINSLTKWAVGWRKRGWRKADGKPVLNRELIEHLLNLYEARSGRTEVEWVKGHAGDDANEFVDRLAVSHTK